MQARSRILFHRGVSLLAAAALVLSLMLASSPAFAAGDGVAPRTPDDLTSTIKNSTTVALSWEQTSNSETVDYYQIFRVYENAVEYADAFTFIGRTSDDSLKFEDTVVYQGEYHYAVMAVDTDGDASNPSDWHSVLIDTGSTGYTPDDDNPAPPTTLRFLVGTTKKTTLLTNTGEIKLTWTASASSDVNRYVVERSPNVIDWEVVGYAYNANTFTDTTIDADGIYWYQVTAQDRVGNVSDPTTDDIEAVVDTMAPDVTINYPYNGAYVGTSGTMEVRISTEPDNDWTTARYFIDDEQQGRTSPNINLSSLSHGWHSLRVEAKDEAGNWGQASVLFYVGTTSGSLNPPEDLDAGPAYSNSRTVSLAWTASDGAPTGTDYKVYRSRSNSTPQLVKTTKNTYATDAVGADGTYTYYVVAQYGNDSSPVSNTDTITVDTVAPTVTISAPKNGTTYKNTQWLTPAYVIADVTSGSDTDDVDLYLNDERFTATRIDLSDLATNRNHTFTVWVMDRAGNVTEKSVTFRVSATIPDDDDDDDDDDDLPVDIEELTDLLMSLRGEIQHGHFVSLQAQLRTGNLYNFAMHVIKHRGKHISEEAADELLEALGADDWNIDPRSIPDSLIEGWGGGNDKPGKGNGRR